MGTDFEDFKVGASHFEWRAFGIAEREIGAI